MHRTFHDKNDRWMIHKETWKVGTDCDKMEKFLKYHMHVPYLKSVIFKKKKLSKVTIKKSTVFYLNKFKNTPRPNWEMMYNIIK